MKLVPATMKTVLLMPSTGMHSELQFKQEIVIFIFIFYSSVKRNIK
jgi:hypothetical protein